MSYAQIGLVVPSNIPSPRRSIYINTILMSSKVAESSTPLNGRQIPNLRLPKDFVLFLDTFKTKPVKLHAIPIQYTPDRFPTIRDIAT